MMRRLVVLLTLFLASWCHGFTTTVTTTTSSWKGLSSSSKSQESPPQKATCQRNQGRSNLLHAAVGNDNDETTTTTTTTTQKTTTKVNDGSGRGAILLGIVLLLNVWLFSLPPSFRRQDLCRPEEYDVQQQQVLALAQQGGYSGGGAPLFEYPCVTPWRRSIVDYYQSGGGVVFDLSIDPRTVQRNRALWEATFGSGGP
eukprot:CAMPEP_0168742710 /NCGR_PEP_ID=MMETSP0724-20121128/13177_1 /TAXON_ID=265536 /ORGANISM="Amphiprora sp., Strain CCMP467" /LENGTH=198 /DNA_ID=CAMNT_0008790269 /DNA_START=155 /DNA_END=751 /DNA_ORIENTATION=-